MSQHRLNMLCQIQMSERNWQKHLYFLQQFLMRPFYHFNKHPFTVSPTTWNDPWLPFAQHAHFGHKFWLLFFINPVRLVKPLTMANTIEVRRVVIPPSDRHVISVYMSFDTSSSVFWLTFLVIVLWWHSLSILDHITHIWYKTTIRTIAATSTTTLTTTMSVQ